MSERPDPRVGVFDTLLVQGGAVVALDAHLERLAASAAELYGECLDGASIAEQVAAVAASAPLQRIRIDVTTEGVTVEGRPIAERPRGPLTLVPRRVPGGWGCHKWRDRELLDRWSDPGDPTTQLLLLDEDDLLLETGRGNVFAVLDDQVVTPPLDGRILPGVTRATVLEALSALGADGAVRPLPASELAAASEVFVTSSIAGVRPVTSVAGLGSWARGPITAAVDAAVERAWARPG